MLRRSMAMDLLGRLSEHLEYNINIMDENGIIIASTDTCMDARHFHNLSGFLTPSNKIIKPATKHRTM